MNNNINNGQGNMVNNGNGMGQPIQQPVIAPQQPIGQPVQQPMMQPQPMAQPSVAPMADAPKKTSGVCIAALIFAFLISPVGLILGIVGLATYKKNNQKGKGLAIAAILISILLPVLMVVLLFGGLIGLVNGGTEAATAIQEGCNSLDANGAYESSDGTVVCKDFSCEYEKDGFTLSSTCNLITNTGDDTEEDDTDNTVKSGTLYENVDFEGYMCVGEECTIDLYLNEDDDETVSYTYTGTKLELVKILKDYEDYIKVNAYVDETTEKINDIELFLMSTGENISTVSTEDELRTKIGLYIEGTYTEVLTVDYVGMPGVGFDGDNSYTYENYSLTDSKGNEYEMKYIVSGSGLNLEEDKEYTVTFEVKKGTFDYEYYIKSVK